MPRLEMHAFKQSWKEAWSTRLFRLQLFLAVVFLLSIPLVIPHFFDFIQQRNGLVLDDPLLQMLPPRDFSTLTFGLIYSSIIASLIVLLMYPLQLLRALQAYCLLTVLRIICLWLVPLNDPPQLIVLVDPFARMIGYGGRAVTKDLFFSGHTSTLTLLVLSVPMRWLKVVLSCVLLTVASLILIQHVHYTIDVVAAPFFALASYAMCARIVPAK